VFKRLTELIVRISDLLEAEGRLLRDAVRTEGQTLRKHVTNASLGAAVLLVAAPLGIAGLCLLLLALFLVLRDSVGTAGAAAITGVVTLAVTGVLIWLFKFLTK
jgi:hypothetical protein